MIGHSSSSVSDSKNTSKMSFSLILLNIILNIRAEECVNPQLDADCRSCSCLKCIKCQKNQILKKEEKRTRQINLSVTFGALDLTGQVLFSEWCTFPRQYRLYRIRQ